MPFDLQDFAIRYAAAWCSQNAASVASFFAPDGALKINSGVPSVGREAIAGAAQSFMTAFPDLKVMMDSVGHAGTRSIFHWTLEGHNTGPGGTGAFVRISGYEEWLMSEEGMIADSLGHFDEADWKRQIAGGKSD